MFFPSSTESTYIPVNQFSSLPIYDGASPVPYPILVPGPVSVSTFPAPVHGSIHVTVPTPYLAPYPLPPGGTMLVHEQRPASCPPPMYGPRPPSYTESPFIAPPVFSSPMTAPPSPRPSRRPLEESHKHKESKKCRDYKAQAIPNVNCGSVVSAPTYISTQDTPSLAGRR